MQKLWINLFAPALLLIAVTTVSSQQPKPDPRDPRPAPAKDKEAAAKSKLEEMLEIALTHNPDIKVAEAKAREAEAEVNRTRLAVTQKVVQLYNDLEAARAKAMRWQAEANRLRNKAATGGGIDHAMMNEIEAQFVQAKAELAKLEAEMPYLLGQPKFKGVGAEMAVVQGLKWLEGNDKAALDLALRHAKAEWLQATENLHRADADVVRWKAEVVRADKLLKEGTFDTQTRDEIYSQLAASNAARDEAAAKVDAANAKYEMLRAYASPKMDAAVSSPQSDKLRAALDKPMSAEFNDITLREVLTHIRKANPDLFINYKGTHEDVALPSAKFKDMPLGAVLQWLEDELPGNRIVVREYGLLIAPSDKLPPDALPLHDFWKAKPKDVKK